jgi:hypothetical protein
VMGRRVKPEADNLGPIWRRSLLESAMRTRTTRLEAAVVVVVLIGVVASLIAAVALLFVYLLPSFLGSA